MKKLIDKDALVAEIERLQNDEFLCDSYDMATGFQSALRMVQEFINTLEVEEVDFDDFGFYWGEYVSNLGGDINNYEVAKYFYELGLNSQTKDMQEVLRMEYEKGRADVIADTLSWLDNCWPKYCSNQTIIEGFKEAIKD